MTLANKYLRYSQEITLEIFELVWNKLIESGFKNKYDNKLYSEFKAFRNRHNYLVIDDTYFNTIMYLCIKDELEITVQEILGYDPFIKDDFVLPDKWCIKSQSRDQDRLINEFARSCGGEHWSDEKNHARSNYLNIIDGRYCRGSIASDKDFTEITFDQFKKYVLKESIETSKETEPQYVECINVATCNTKVGEIFKCRHSNGHFEFEYNDKSKENFNSWDGWSVPWSNELPQKHFKPSTKEAFDAQNKPIEKWSVGSYVVFLKDYGGHPKGTIDKIIADTNSINVKVSLPFYTSSHCNLSKIDEARWFATKAEAEEFAKTLVEPVKEEVKQPLKQAVHCKTQEEWDFVSDKIKYKFTTKFELRVNDTINPALQSCECKSFYERRREYQLLSFQEWCDLNGYKMEKEVRYATPEEIYNHSISIGQIPTGEPLNVGIELNKDGAFKYITYYGATHVGKTSTIPGPLKMILSIDDEELPMVNIIKTNTIKQLLNND